VGCRCCRAWETNQHRRWQMAGACGVLSTGQRLDAMQYIRFCGIGINNNEVLKQSDYSTMLLANSSPSRRLESITSTIGQDVISQSRQNIRVSDAS